VTLTNQNFTHEDIKKRLNLVNACNHSLQNILSSCSVPTGIQTITYLHLIFFLFYMGMKLGLTFKGGHGLKIFINSILRERNWQD